MPSPVVSCWTAMAVLAASCLLPWLYLSIVNRDGLIGIVLHSRCK
jgi:hypothetical protein